MTRAVGPLQVEISGAVAEAFPGYRAGFVVAEGVANGPSVADGSLEAAAAPWRGVERLADVPHIAAWRAAFGAFGAKPKRYQCSAEALMARALSPEGLPRINRLVDLYNAVSVRHAIPVGGEDLDRLVGGVRLAFAGGDEDFDGGDPPKPGEVVWADDAGVTCRRWNWRQGVRTRLTETTTRAYFLFDALPPLGDDELRVAMDELAGALVGLCPGARLRSEVLAGPG